MIEAAILATRTHLLERDHVLAEFERLAIPVQKTAGADEEQAFALLTRFVNERYEETSCAK